MISKISMNLFLELIRLINQRLIIKIVIMELGIDIIQKLCNFKVLFHFNVYSVFYVEKKTSQKMQSAN